MDWPTNRDNCSPKERGSGTFKFLLWAIAVTVLIAVFRSIGTNEPNSIPATTEPVTRPLTPPPARDVIRTTSYDLNLRYEANEVAVDQEIGKSRIQITGIVESIDKDFMDDAILKLNGNTLINLLDNQKPAAAKINKGDTITVLCDRVRRVMGDPIGGDCIITTPQ